jgi:7-carboxy-7-deazaguanine synthase
MTSLRIFEIFHSLQGESSRVGLPTVFVRLTGCPLRCGYCDTEYAFHGGSTQTLEEILQEVAQYEAQYVCVTGGEPLAQKACHELLTALCDAGYSVSLETSGAIDISQVDDRVSVIMDIKTPGSGEESKNLWANIAHLKAKDEVKFVLADRPDYDWAREILEKYQVLKKSPVLFSPVYKTLPPADLAKWILEDHLSVRMQLQLHKILWGEKPGV